MARTPRKIKLIAIVLLVMILFTLAAFILPARAAENHAGGQAEGSVETSLPAPEDGQASITNVTGDVAPLSLSSQPQSGTYPFGNPAGCAPADAPVLSPEEMLANVQAALGGEYNLAERRQTYIWNGDLGSMVDVTNERFAYEFVFNSFAPPLTYLGDHVATVFLANGFVIWFRDYGGSFRLLAIPMTPGVYESSWAGYLNAYWQPGNMQDDEFVFPVMKKLPCQWAIEQGYVSPAAVAELFDLAWQVPNYLAAGRQYLASTCQEANRVAREEIGYWDASTMCGPLAWTILHEVNGFPYRIGAWTAGPAAFTAANPRWNGQPWGSFDPETFTVAHIGTPMPGYDFAALGNLYPGDLVYSFGTPYVTAGYFDHIFLVAGIDGSGARLSVSNMLQNYPSADCSIQEIVLYTPGDRASGVINQEWNDGGYGRTGTTGFDVFRWDWITYHANGQAIDYTVRWGDTIETIAFDWKISPESLRAANQLGADAQLMPGQVLLLPALGIDASNGL